MKLSTNSHKTVRVVVFASLCCDVLSSSIPMRRSNIPTTLQRRDGEKECKKVDSRLPDSFKCTIQDSKCISLDDGSSAICCVDSQDCTAIAPVSCDIQRQNVTKFPSSPILSTALTRNLPTCGVNCCPLGYDCIAPADDDDPFCSLIVARSSLSEAKQQSSSSSSSTSTSATTTSTSRSTSSATAAAATTANLSSTIDSQSHGGSENPFPPGVFMAGLFPGMVVGSLLLLAWVIYSGRHKKSGSDSRRESGSSSRPIISHPIPMTGGLRSDFARRFQDRLSKAKSTFSNGADSNPWKSPTPPVPSNIPERYAHVPTTPKGREDREPSLHSIKVYSPPSMIQHPSIAVPPLRTMTTHRRQPPVDSLGSPYQSPMRADAAYQYDAPASEPIETLGSQRYESDRKLRSKKEGRYEDSEADKRDTSFTALMAHCNIPDEGDEFPVPRVLKPYETRY